MNDWKDKVSTAIAWIFAVAFYGWIPIAIVYGLVTSPNSSSSTQSSQTQSVEAPVCTIDRNAILASIQAERSAKGISQFTEIATLDSAASEKLNDMVTNLAYGGNFADGSNWYKSVRSGGINAEIGFVYNSNYLTSEEAWNGFKATSELTDPDYTKIGIAAQCTDYTVSKTTSDDASDRLNEHVQSLTVIYYAKDEPVRYTAPTQRCEVTLCNDGSCSYSTGRGTCSWHGGVNRYY